MPVDLAAESGALVRRARMGDQNAMALIREIGLAARAGGRRARQAFEMIKKYIQQNQAPATAADKGGLFGFGGETSTLPPAPRSLMQTEEMVRAAATAQQAKPELPHGALDRLFDPDHFPLVVVKACKYRNGLAAAAVVLAAGPSLTRDVVQEMGLSTFGSDETSAAFFHGVKFCTDADLREAGKAFDAYLRRPLVVGQCVGRAWRLQAVRRPNSRISVYAPVAGWELGE